MTSVQHWGTIVKDLAEEHGITQRSLASLAGMNRTTLRKLIAGYERVTIADLQRVLGVFGYEFDAVRIVPHRIPDEMVFRKEPGLIPFAGCDQGNAHAA